MASFQIQHNFLFMAQCKNIFSPYKECNSDSVKIIDSEAIPEYSINVALCHNLSNSPNIYRMVPFQHKFTK